MRRVYSLRPRMQDSVPDAALQGGQPDGTRRHGPLRRQSGGAAPPATGSFTADMALTPEFGTAGDFGAVSGRATGFALADGDPSPLTGLRPLPAPIAVSNVEEQAAPPAAPLPGGWVDGETAASADGTVAGAGDFSVTSAAAATRRPSPAPSVRRTAIGALSVDAEHILPAGKR